MIVAERRRMTAAVKKIERMSHTMQQFNSLASPETRSDEVEAARRFQFAIHHVGINCGDPETGLETARVLCALSASRPARCRHFDLCRPLYRMHAQKRARRNGAYLRHHHRC